MKNRIPYVIGGAVGLLVVGAVILWAAVDSGTVSLPRKGSEGGSVLAKVSNPNKDQVHLNAEKEGSGICIACHKDTRTDEKPWHKMHLEAPMTKLTCTLCHKKIVVKERSMDGTVYVDRTICRQCHRNKFPAFTPQHQKPTWVKEHKNLRGQKEKTVSPEGRILDVGIPTMDQLSESYPQCFICHRNKELNFCSECHEEHDHDVEWINGEHGRTAVKTNFECLRCHEKKTWCSTECHEGVTLPHNIPKWREFWAGDPDAPQWRRIHFEVARSEGFSKCRRCHDSPRSLGEHPDFCMECHHEQFYKNPEFNVTAEGEPAPIGTPWIAYAMNVAKNHGAERCWQCHMPSFCSFCHRNGSKAPPGLFFNRAPEE